MNGQATAVVAQFPIPDEEQELSWIQQRFHDIGVISMSNTQRPPGFYVNWTSLAAITAIVTAIAGLWWFTAVTFERIGYDKGKAEVEKIQMQKQIDEAKAAASKAKDIALGSMTDEQQTQEQKKK